MNSSYTKINSITRFIAKSLIACMAILLFSQVSLAEQVTASIWKSNSPRNQERLLSVHVENELLPDVLQDLARKVKVGISYETEIVPSKKVSYQAEKKSVFEILEAILKDTDLQAVLSDNRKVIVIQKKAPEDRVVLQSTVIGTVTDMTTGETLPGVNILVKGTSTGASTDADGQYELEVESLQDTLVVSYIGYQTKEVAINGRTRIDVGLQSQAISGEEMVVTALGVKQKKRSLTYDTKSIETKSLTEAREFNVINSLEGKVAGLSITQSPTGVGSASRVVLRGNRSINGNNEPLYVIDGVPVIGKPQYLTSDNIGSINVIKGPNGAALYGSDAQNGAIIISTKEGQKGVKISLNNTFIVNKANVEMPIQNVYGQGVAGKFLKNSQFSWGPKMEGQMVKNWNHLPSSSKTYALNPQPNNIKDLYQTGFNISNNLQLSSGNENYRSFFSATSTEGRGITPTNNLQRNNILARITGTLPSSKFSWNTKASYTRQVVDHPLGRSRSTYNPHKNIFKVPRSIRSQDMRDYEFPAPNGVMQQNSWGPSIQNPYWTLHRVDGNEKADRFTGMASLTYNFTDELSLMGRASYDRINKTTEESVANGTFIRAPNGRYTLTKNDSYVFNTDLLLSYEKDLNEEWHLDTRLGGSLKKQRLGKNFSANTGDALLIPNLFTLSNSNNPITTYDRGLPTNIQSVYALAKIGWEDAIYLNLTGRNDWSSTLPSDNRSYFYPSVGLTAILSDLIPGFSKPFSFLSVRASYAKVGSSGEPFRLQRNTTFEPGGNNGFLQLETVLPNKNLKPQQTKSYETGLDARFINGRIGVNLTYFQTNTTNQLFTIGLPVASGASSFYTNGGKIRGKGVEAELKGIPIQTKNVNWTVDLSFSHLKNEVVRISDQRPKIVVDGPYNHDFSDFVLKEGLDFGSMFVQGFERDSKGRVIVKSNGIPKLSNSKNYNIGTFTPDWEGTFSSSFDFKNWSLSFVISHRQGGVAGSNTRKALSYRGVLKETLQGRDGGLIFGKNIFSNYFTITDRGTPNNTPISAQDLWQNMPSSVFALDATNTRVKELTIGYNLPEKMLGNIPISSARISLVGRNLFFISRATPGFNPNIATSTEMGSIGYSNYPPPARRSFGMNIKVDF